MLVEIYNKQDSFVTCFKDCTRTGYETACEICIFLDKKERRTKERKNKERKEKKEKERKERKKRKREKKERKIKEGKNWCRLRLA